MREVLSVNDMLLSDFRQRLATEMTLMQVVGENSLAMPNLLLSNAGTEVRHKIEVLWGRTQNTAEDLRRMEQDYQALVKQYQDYTNVNALIQQYGSQPRETIQNLQMQKGMIEQALNSKISNWKQLRVALIEKFQETLRLLTQLQTHVLDEELLKWKREQQLNGNGAAFKSNLNTIQEWCESLAELISLNRQQIKEVERVKVELNIDPPGITDVLRQLSQEITQLLSTLVTSTFIIEKQPPQVMKTNTRFSATVRLLVGGKLNVNVTPPQVNVTIISESQAKKLLENGKLDKSGESSDVIVNNSGRMEYQQDTRQLSVSFRHMKLKKIKRAEKKGTESVMDEKCALIFQTQFSVGGGELTFRVWTLSLPVVVIVHGSQEPQAWATVTWDNAFCELDRVPFAVPDKVEWSKVAETLSMKFEAATGRPLTDDNLQFLGEKAFRGYFDEANNPTLSWAQFCKEPLSERDFTFWEWFYAIMKLTREHLKRPWKDGSIMGFVRKKQAEGILSARPCGTFLLRFSDSELGGITIAWVSGIGEVFSLKPFTAKDFSVRTLPNIISDLSHLYYLYPNIPKDVPFGQYYTPTTDDYQASKNGYIVPKLVIQVPGFTCAGGTYSQATTLKYSLVQSPDSSRDTSSVVSSYAGSVSTTATTAGPSTPSMDYLNELDEFNIVYNRLANRNESMG